MMYLYVLITNMQKLSILIDQLANWSKKPHMAGSAEPKASVDCNIKEIKKLV